MFKVSGGFQIPEFISLKHCQQVGDVRAMARDLENAIENFISVRALDVSSSRKEKWKTCVKRWFLAAFPLVNCVIEIAEASNL